MAKGRKRADNDEQPTTTDDEHPEIEQAARLRLADDVPDLTSAADDAVEDATAADDPASAEIDSRFANQDLEFGDQLAEAVDQAGAEEDPLAAQFGVDFGQPVTGRERLADIMSDPADDTSQDPGGRYGKEMIMGDAGGGSGGSGGEVVSGHPGAYGVGWKDGEVSGHYAVSPVDDDGEFLGINVSGMAYEKEMTKKAEEVAAGRNSGSGTPSGTGTGSGSGSGSGNGSGSGSGSGSGGGGPTGSTTTNNPDGSITTEYADGTTIVTQADGSQAVINPDGSVDYYKPDGSHDHHEPPPPKEDPPAEDPPKEDPPKDDKPKEDPPKDDAAAGGAESQPDEDYVDPEFEAILRAELAENPQYAHYQNSKQNDGVTDPVDDAVGTPVVTGGDVPDLRERGYDMFGQPDPDAQPDGGPSDAGYWDDPNHGAVDFGEDHVDTGGPQRNDSPFGDTGNKIEPPGATGGEEEETADDGSAVFVPPYEDLTLVEERPDLPDFVEP